MIKCNCYQVMFFLLCFSYFQRVISELGMEEDKDGGEDIKDIRDLGMSEEKMEGEQELNMQSDEIYGEKLL